MMYLGSSSSKYQNDSPNQNDYSMFLSNTYENHSESPTGNIVKNLIKIIKINKYVSYRYTY